MVERREKNTRCKNESVLHLAGGLNPTEELLITSAWLINATQVRIVNVQSHQGAHLRDKSTGLSWRGQIGPKMKRFCVKSFHAI